jgi:SPP1 family predicted phage head-tail adaptor
MDAGEMAARVVLKRRVGTMVSGKESVDYPVVATVSAKADPIRGREFMTLQAAQSEIEIRFTIYYRTDVRADWRVEWRGQDYEIVGPPIDVGARKQYLEIYARTAQT